MVKNYSGTSFFKKSVLIVTACLFLNFNAFSQKILNVLPTQTSICQGDNLDFQFTVKNGGGGSVGFDTETIYTVYIVYTTQSGNTTYYTTLDQTDFTNKVGPAKMALEERVINHKITVGRNVPSRSDYKLLITSSNPAIPARIEGISTRTFQLNANNGIVYTETETGTNSWIGHVYDGTNQNIDFKQNFIDYKGGYTETISFDQQFGGNQDNFNIGSGACVPSINTESFSVRYRMNSSLKGLYAFNIGSDDGSRLSADGQLVYNDWSNHAYRNQNVLLNLFGNSNLVLDYYENSGGNRISVGTPQLLIENQLTTNINQTLNSQNNPQNISGDIFKTLPNGIIQIGTGYQWVYSTTSGGTTTNISGATQATYTPNKNIAPFNNPGTYYVYRLANLNGNNTGQNNYVASSKSNPATIVVRENITINSQPKDVTVCTGNQISFSVNATGQNLNYRWQRNDGGNTGFYNISNGGAFSGTQTSGLIINTTENSLNNIKFRVVINDSNGNSLASNSALLQLNPSPQGVNTQPSNQLVCTGNNISFQTYTSNDNRQWQVSKDSGVSWSDLSNNEFYQNVNSEKLDITKVPISFNNNLYRIKVSNQTCNVFSNSASLRVDPDPITQQPQNVTAPFGSNVFIEAGVSGDGLSFQWQTFSSNWFNIDNNGDYSGAKTKKLELITVGNFPEDGSRYRLLVTNANGCTSISQPAFLNVVENECTELPTITINAPSIVCQGPVNINGVLTGTGPWNIQTKVNGQNFNLNINENTFSYPVDIQQNTTIEILKITDANACENIAPDELFTIKVINSITNNTILGAQESCGPLDAEILTGEDLGEGYKYLWEVSTTNENTGFVAASGINNERDYDPGFVSQTSLYRRVVEVQNCTSNISNAVKITINSEIINNNISFFNGNSGTLRAIANENQQINLNAPEGTVFTYVNFASYGIPDDNNGSFTINESCHAFNSQSITESFLLGRNMANILANNTVFTDPCVGTFKRLVVTATYSEAICAGTNPATVTGSTINGNNISYTWKISKEGPSSGFANAPGSNNLQNYNVGILREAIWLKRVVSSGSCSNESAILYIPVKEENIWTGTQDNNWNNINNWSCNILPTLETNVLIPENLVSGNYPIVNLGNNALAKNLTIENTGSILVNDNWLRIAGIFSNNGDLYTSTGSISFEGTAAQTIPESAFENNRIRNLSIYNISGVTSEAIIEVTGILKIESGSFYTGNELTLISNEIQTALIDGSGIGEIVGLVSMQRYLDKAFGYKYFSAPFQNSVVGDFMPYMDFEDPISGFPNFYRYNENRNININNSVRDATGWEVYTNATATLNIAEGYALNFGVAGIAETIEIIGEVNNGNITTRSLENNHRDFTRGFHLVGNPYPSPIDWNASQGWTRTNIDDGIYFFTAGTTNQYTGTYTAYVNDISTVNPLEDGRSSNIIPSMQGYFIKVSDSDTENLVTGSFGMDNRVRVTNFNQEFLKSQTRDQKSIIRLEAGFNNANRKDPMVIYFSPYATQNFEKEMDAHKLMNTDPTVPSFYNITENKKELAINAIPFPESKSYNKIRIGIKADQSGVMNINLTSIENLSSNFNIYLIDHEKTIGQNLRDKSEYTFNIQAGTHDSRFELMFSEEEITSPAIAFNKPFDVEVEDGNVVIILNLENNQEGILRASTIAGQILQTKTVSGKDRIIFDGITSNGVYIINLQVGKEQYAKKILINK